MLKPSQDWDVQELAAVIRQVLHVTTMPSLEDFAQDLLDVLAVGAGLKPAAVIGFGYAVNDSVDNIIALTATMGMATSMSHPWQAACDAEDLPSWYVDTLARFYGSTPIHIVTATPTSLNALVTSKPPISAQQESVTLGYPICCVTEYHRRRKAYHLLTLGMLARQVDGNEVRMRRLVKSGVAMAPKGETETNALLSATQTDFATFTSIAMCDACATEPDSPARRISTQFRQLADQTELLPFLTPA
jgi:hypothetical protein